MSESSVVDSRRIKCFLGVDADFQLANSGCQVRAGILQSIPSSEGLQEYPSW
jgi:hypothetical protein